MAVLQAGHCSSDLTLAQELPYATGAALKRGKKKERKKERERERKERLILLTVITQKRKITMR